MTLRTLSAYVLSILALLISPYTALAGPAPLSSDFNSSYNYVAMGDSVAAGAGLGGDRSAICDRSSDAYPHLLAESLGTDVKQLACSGAKVDEGIYRGQERGEYRIAAQLDRAFHHGTPDLITITIGANDIRWQNYLAKCHYFDCGTRTDKVTAVGFRLDLRAELHYLLYRINQLSDGNPPQVLINGYYSPIADTTCSDTGNISDDEAEWLNEQVGYLNDSLERVADLHRSATFVPIDFSGHELCSDDPWVQSLRDDATFHPTAEGQRFIAETNLDAINR